MFDPERFVGDCRAAFSKDGGGLSALREVIVRAVADQAGLLKAFGEPRQAAVQRLYVGEDITVLHFVWPPGIIVRPHDHRTWAVIGVYSGAEDNVFWRRLPTDRGGMRSIEAAGAQSMRAGDVAVLEADIVHSVINPISRFTCSLQIYGGNFYAIERSEWDPDSLREQPYDLNAARRKFEDANAALGRNETSGGD